MKNLFQFHWTTLLAWTAAFCIIEPVSYYVIPATLKSKAVQEYYDIEKTPVAVVTFGDYIYSTFLFLVSLIVISFVWGNPPSVSISGWIVRFLTFVAVQWTGDLSFYMILQKLKTTGKYIDFFKRYTKEVSVGAPIGDSIYGIAWFTTAQLVITYLPLILQVISIVLFAFSTLVLSY